MHLHAKQYGAKFLHEEIEAVCPIDGVSIRDPDDPSTWRVHFRADATAEQRAAAQAIVQGWTGEKWDQIEAREQKGRAVAAAVEAKKREQAFDALIAAPPEGFTSKDFQDAKAKE